MLLLHDQQFCVQRTIIRLRLLELVLYFRQGLLQLVCRNDGVFLLLQLLCEHFFVCLQFVHL